VLASICFALKDIQTGFSDSFWNTFSRQLETNSQNFKEENKELVETAVRDNRNLQQLRNVYKAKDL
jgi:hypothetical protein